jgi:hypothetical protein
MIMGGIAFELKHSLNIFVVVMLAGLAYASLLYILKVVKKEDLASILASFRKKPAEDIVE